MERALSGKKKRNEQRNINPPYLSHMFVPLFKIGTSSRSTKLVHGGVRYLEKAVRELDIEQYKLVKEALNERANFLKIAPYLSYQLPIMLPVYK